MKLKTLFWQKVTFLKIGIILLKSDPLFPQYVKKLETSEHELRQRLEAYQKSTVNGARSLNNSHPLNSWEVNRRVCCVRSERTFCEV